LELENPNNLEQLRTDLLKLITNNKNYLIGISGIDCSGKSTLTKMLYDFLLENNINTYFLSGDDFLFDRETRYANPNQIQGYYNESFNYEMMFNEIILPAMNSSTFSKGIEHLDWQNNKMVTREFTFKSPFVLILEGVFIFKEQYIKHFDYKVWLDISFKDALKRAFQRSRDIEYYGDKNTIMKRYTERFYPAQLYHILNDNPDESCDAKFDADIKEKI
jgi:uridine kinase